MPKSANLFSRLGTTIGGVGAAFASLAPLNQQLHQQFNLPPTGILEVDAMVVAVGGFAFPWLAALARINNERAQQHANVATEKAASAAAAARAFAESESERKQVLQDAGILEDDLRKMPEEFEEDATRLRARLAEFVAPVLARRSKPPFKVLRTEIENIDKERINLVAPLKPTRSGPSSRLRRSTSTVALPPSELGNDFQSIDKRSRENVDSAN